MKRVPVIAISGHPGCGKTTLAGRMRRRFGVPVVSYDDYETITSEKPETVAQWLGSGADYDAIALPAMEAEIERLATLPGEPRPRFVLVDTLLGRAHAATGRLIDYSIWIDMPADIALSRKLRQAAGRAAKAGSPPAFIDWLDAWLGHYEQFIADTYRGQTERVRPLADISIDGRQAPDAVVLATEAAIRKALERLE
jgi:uridine kinase